MNKEKLLLGTMFGVLGICSNGMGASHSIEIEEEEDFFDADASMLCFELRNGVNLQPEELGKKMVELARCGAEYDKVLETVMMSFHLNQQNSDHNYMVRILNGLMSASEDNRDVPFSVCENFYRKRVEDFQTCSVGLGETLRAMRKASCVVEMGKLLSIYVSNFYMNRLLEAQDNRNCNVLNIYNVVSNGISEDFNSIHKIYFSKNFFRKLFFTIISNEEGAKKSLLEKFIELVPEDQRSTAIPYELYFSDNEYPKIMNSLKNLNPHGAQYAKILKNVFEGIRNSSTASINGFLHYAQKNGLAWEDVKTIVDALKTLEGTQELVDEIVKFYAVISAYEYKFSQNNKS